MTFDAGETEGGEGHPLLISRALLQIEGAGDGDVLAKNNNNGSGWQRHSYLLPPLSFLPRNLEAAVTLTGIFAEGEKLLFPSLTATTTLLLPLFLPPFCTFRRPPLPLT